MYINIGGDMSLRSRDIIGVFDLDNTTSSRITQNFLNKAEKEGKVITISLEELPKSFILTAQKNIYLSPVRPETLIRRMNPYE